MCRKSLYFLLWILFGLTPVTASDSGYAFVNPQSSCKLECQNGGVCAYSIENPSKHKCICFIGMYEGEMCEILVTSTSITDMRINEPSTSSEQSLTYDTEFEASPEETAYDPSEKFNNDPGTYPSEYWEPNSNQQLTNDEQYLTVNNPYLDEDSEERKYYSNREKNKENLAEEEEDGWMMVKRSKSQSSGCINLRGGFLSVIMALIISCLFL